MKGCGRSCGDGVTVSVAAVFFGLGGGFFLLLWPILLVLIVFYLFKKNKGETDDCSAIRVLEEEYARGNITREEFIEKKQNILK